jgi:serine protease Do
MVIAGGLNVTPLADADRPTQSPLPVMAAGAPDFAVLAERVVPSVVSVYSTDVEEPSERRARPAHPFEFFFGPQGDGREQDDEPNVRQSSGSGFFISADGELLTNNHVIEEADKIEIALDDQTRYQAKVIGRDPETDLALIKVVNPDRQFAYLPLGDAASLRVGEWVMAVGNPLNMDHTVTVGVVSAKGRVLGLSDSSFEDFIQTDAAINFGNSGGPLVNLRGEVVGINSAINARGQNLGFAIPVDIASRILAQLRTGKVVRGYLGVMVRNIDQEMQEAFDLASRDGALIEQVVAGHAGAKAGLEPGDVVTSVNGTAIATTRELIDLVSAQPPGAKVKLEVMRKGKRSVVDVVLEERESQAETAAPEATEEVVDLLSERVGVNVAELSDRSRQMYGVGRDVEGVVITRVKNVSPAGEEGLSRGDVITQALGEPVSSVADLERLVGEVDKGGLLRLYVFRPRADRSFFAILRLDGE